MTFKSTLDLGQLMTLLGQALPAYSQLFPRLEFGSFAPFVLTPDKPNTARTLVPVKYNGAEVGEMFAIAFMPGDGTGDYNTYKPGQLEIPPQYALKEKQEKVFPRSKTGTVFELFLPFGSVAGGKIHLFASSLEELTIDETEAPLTLRKAWDLGMARCDYGWLVNHGGEVAPRIQLTTGYRPDGERFGDPHAVYFGVDTNTVQVVGFLPVTSQRSPVVELAQKVALLPV